MKKVIYTNPPVACDLCKDPLLKEFSDARIPSHNGIWGAVCTPCADVHQVVYGCGLGQKYVKNDDGQFVKVLG